ncbi:MAG TPA: PadR family transcriptional regulator [Candidatus Dormibacteraeota bacterium]|jgi:DNA-binding PadR family transcriptional regulator|nr:PadR family transcriptional regulator [Candidatus Dormibacteraeota bacterium]
MSAPHGDGWGGEGDMFRPRHLLQPCILILLAESAGYGYELTHRLDDIDGARADSPAVYRALNGLEESDLVSSHWERSASGPERRCYAITPRGREVLAGWVAKLARMNGTVAQLLRRYERSAEPVAAC